MTEQVVLRRCKTSVEYRVLKQISKGSYGDVFLAERVSDSLQVCLKQVDLDFLSPQERLGCLAEVQFLQSLPRHPNVVACYDAFWEDTSDLGNNSRVVLVLEYGNGGDLDVFVQNEYAVQRVIPVDVALGIFAQITRGLAFLHDHHVIHRDVKSKNVFRFTDGRVVIGDFGTCKSLAHTTALANTLVGSPLYMSPELLEDKPYSFSSDVWSLGCVLYELLVGRTPFLAASYPAVVLKITTGVYSPLPSSVPTEIHALVARMLSLDPGQRPTVRELLSDAYMSRYVAAVEIPETIETASKEVVAELLTVDGASASEQEDLDDFQLVLPPPAPAIALKSIASSVIATQPPPAPPPQPVKAAQAKPRSGSAVFPTNRSRLADILSKERLKVHKTSKQHQDNAKFLSCVPMLDSSTTGKAPPQPSHPAKKTSSATAKTTPSASTKPRAPIPTENMMIIGTKVHNVRTDNTAPTSDRLK